MTRIHAYDSINLGIIWAIVTTNLPDLPGLIEQLERILDEGSA